MLRHQYWQQPSRTPRTAFSPFGHKCPSDGGGDPTYIYIYAAHILCILRCIHMYCI